MRIFTLLSILVLLLGLIASYEGLIVAYNSELYLQQQIRILSNAMMLLSRQTHHKVVR